MNLPFYKICCLRYIFIILLGLASYCTAFAQDIHVDSLRSAFVSNNPNFEYPFTCEKIRKQRSEKWLKRAPNIKFHLGIFLIEHYRQINIDSAIYFNKQLFGLKLSDADESIILLKLGELYMMKAYNPDTISTILEKSLKLSQKVDYKDGGKSFNTGYVQLVLGEYYEHHLDAFDEAYKNYLGALEAMEYQKNNDYINMLLLRLTRISRKKGEQKLAEQYGKRLIAYLMKNDEDKGVFWNDLQAAVYYELGNLERAVFYYEKSAEIYRQAKNTKLEVAWTVKKLGSIYKDLGQYEKSRKTLKEALIYAKENNYRYDILSDLAEVELLQKKYQQAIIYANEGLNGLNQHKEDYKSLRLVFYNVLRKSYRTIGNYKDALQANDEYIALKDTIQALNNNKKLIQINLETKIQQKEAENKRLKAEKASQEMIDKQKTIITVISILLALFLGLLAILQKRARDYKHQQNNLLEQKVAERTAELLQTSQELAEVKHIQLLEEAKNRFFTNVSHEFRTPLTLIQGPLSIIQKNEQLSPIGSEMLEKAVNNSRQLQKLVNQVLDLTKFDAGQLTINEERTVFYLFIRRVIANFETITELKNIELRLEYQFEQSLQLEIDKEKIEGILNNYLSNAIKFTPKNGSITVKVVDFENKLQISVADTGIGIPSLDLSMVFNRFYQIPQKGDIPLGQTNIGGTGIGLSLCKEYANLMNGRVWAESPTSKGNGSIFYFEFPKKEIIKSLSSAEISAINTKPTITTQKQNLLIENTLETENPKATILLVEDNYDLRDFVATLLKDKYRILVAENGEDALNKLNTMTDLPSLILSDVMMPILDGFQLLEHLKSNDTFRHIPVMMLTARSQMGDKLKALRIGVDDYMLKPFEDEELEVRVDNLIMNFNNRMSLMLNDDDDDETESSVTQSASKTAAVSHSIKENEWLAKLEANVQASITDFSFNADVLAEQMLISRSKLFRLTKKITGMTVNAYIKEVRLQTARMLIENNKVESTKEAAYNVGYKNVDYFAQSYEKRFGKRPSEILYE